MHAMVKNNLEKATALQKITVLPRFWLSRSKNILWMNGTQIECFGLNQKCCVQRKVKAVLEGKWRETVLSRFQPVSLQAGRRGSPSSAVQ